MSPRKPSSQKAAAETSAALPELESLKRELHRLSTALNMLPFPVWQRAQDLTIHACNIACSELMGEGSATEIDARAKALAQHALHDGQPKSERRHMIVDGQRRLYQFQEFPVFEEQALVGCAQDISELEQLQEEMQRHISAQDDLLESSASAMAIYGADMRLKSFNQAFVRLWKLDEAWLDTEPTLSEILEMLRERRRLPEQANFQTFKQQQQKLFTALIETHEEFWYLPDGKALRVIAIPHALGGILFAYEDVTDRLALERSYNTLIAVQRETLDHLHEGIAVFGEDGRLKLSNPIYLDLWGLDADYAQSEPHMLDIIERCKSFYLYSDWDEFKKKLAADLHSRERTTHRGERTDGKVINWRVIPLPDGATLVTFLDVTDSTLLERSLRERNEALQEADRLKTEFLANVSYELRSPLTSITGFSEMLKQDYFGALSDKQREYVEGIHQASQHLMQLINDILDLASIEAGYMKLNVSPCDVRAMLQSVVSLTQVRARQHDVTIAVECGKEIDVLEADETRLKQVLFNLMSNAIKFSPSGSEVALGARARDEKHVELYVRDRGEGIPMEEQLRVFDKFYKGTGEAQRAKGGPRSGTGLGLSIVKNFTELHGGIVELESEPGKGTTIRCVIPRA